MVVSFGWLLGRDRVVGEGIGSRESSYTWKCRELGANLWKWKRWSFADLERTKVVGLVLISELS